MVSQITGYEHVVMDQEGVALIEGTTFKVVQLITEHLAYGWSPDELQFQHPYLTLGQIYSALAYYWDHVDELNLEMERRADLVSKMREMSARSPLRDRLKSKGLI